ncbi:YfhO family protein, partial [Streptococcus danieliae]|nr:YfhO family protein [Streptococcus danieliae]
PLFAVSYAMSGMIVSYQMNPIFYDAMIVLPIILVYLEEYLDGGVAYKYIIWLAAAFFLHFYMAFMISLFLGLYVMFYYLWPKDKGEFSLDEDEFINVRKYKLEDAFKLIDDNVITDSKTLLALEWLRNKRRA